MCLPTSQSVASRPSRTIPGWMCPLFVYYGNQPLTKNAIIILRNMIAIKNRHFRSKQDFHLEFSPIENFKSFMSGPPVAKETLVLISTIHHRLAQLRLTISTIHRRLTHNELMQTEQAYQQENFLIVVEYIYLAIFFSISSPSKDCIVVVV